MDEKSPPVSLRWNSMESKYAGGFGIGRGLRNVERRQRRRCHADDIRHHAARLALVVPCLEQVAVAMPLDAGGVGVARGAPGEVAQLGEGAVVDRAVEVESQPRVEPVSVGVIPRPGHLHAGVADASRGEALRVAGRFVDDGGDGDLHRGAGGAVVVAARDAHRPGDLDGLGAALAGHGEVLARERLVDAAPVWRGAHDAPGRRALPSPAHRAVSVDLVSPPDGLEPRLHAHRALRVGLPDYPCRDMAPPVPDDAAVCVCH